MPTLEVKGLRQAAENLADLEGAVQKEIARDSLRAGALDILAAVKGATYTTFIKRSGYIKSGFGVRVGHDLVGSTLNSFIVQYPQNIAGASAATKLFRASVLKSSKRPRSVNLEHVAFYWRFLEFGTRQRRSVREPKGSRTKSQQRALEKFKASHALGAIAARPWVRPAFAATAGQSVEAFAAKMRTEIDAKVSGYPK